MKRKLAVAGEPLEAAAASFDAVAAARPVAPSIAVRLAALVAVSALARFLLALASPSPWIFPDEWIYSELAQSFAGSGHFAVWGTAWPVRTSGPLYPVLISPAYLVADSLPSAYVLVKGLNAAFMSLAAVPAYYLARRLVGHGLAFTCAVFTVLVPAMAYSTKVMTENVAYPLFLFTALAIVRALERPSAARQAAVLGLVAASFLSRGEMLVLVPVYLSSILVLALLDARAEDGRLAVRTVAGRLGAYRPTWLAALAAVLLALAGPLVLGRSPIALLAMHERILHAVRFSQVPRWLLYHVAELDLSSGVIPFAAFLLVVGPAIAWKTSARPVRLFAALSASVFVFFVALAAVYGTQPRPLPAVFERYVFYVTPFLFVALAYWIEQGLPRARRWAPAIAAVALLLPAALPYSTLLNGREWGVSSSTPGLVPWAMLRHLLGAHALLVACVLVLSALLALVFLRARASRLRLAVLCNLWVLTVVVAGANMSLARLADRYEADASPAWVDEAVGTGAEVGAVWAGARAQPGNAVYGILESAFYNESVRGLYDLREPIKPGIPSHPVSVRDGTVLFRDGPEAGRPLSLSYVIADESVGIVGRPLARNAAAHLVLYRVDGLVRLREAAPRLPSEGE